jgi:hypothetical protein
MEVAAPDPGGIDMLLQRLAEAEPLPVLDVRLENEPGL